MTNSKPTRSYTGLWNEELLALAPCSGEAVRLYIALSLFCYGPATKGFAGKEMIAEKMMRRNKKGELLTSKVGWKSNMNKLFRELESHGLFHWGDKRRAWNRTNQWSLPVKAAIVASMKKGKKGQVDSTRGAGKMDLESQVDSTEKSSKKNLESQVNSTHHNSRMNSKLDITIEEYNILYKIKTLEDGSQYEFLRVPEDRIERHKILDKLGTGKGSRILWLYDPTDIYIWYDELMKRENHYPEAKKKMKKFIEDFQWSELDPINAG
jgi:hypothetical protein